MLVSLRVLGSVVAQLIRLAARATVDILDFYIANAKSALVSLSTTLY
jgi:hypothetical protein